MAWQPRPPRGNPGLSAPDFYQPAQRSVPTNAAQNPPGGGSERVRRARLFALLSLWVPPWYGPPLHQPTVIASLPRGDNPPRRRPTQPAGDWYVAPTAPQAPPKLPRGGAQQVAQIPRAPLQVPTAWFAIVPMPQVLADVAHFAGSVDAPPIRARGNPIWLETSWPAQIGPRSAILGSVDNPPLRRALQLPWPDVAWSMPRQKGAAAFTIKLPPLPVISIIVSSVALTFTMESPSLTNCVITAGSMTVRARG